MSKKVRINETYIVPCEAYNDIRVKDGDPSIIECIYYGESSEWVVHSSSWTGENATTYVNSFQTITGEFPSTLDFVTYKYLVQDNNITQTDK